MAKTENYYDLEQRTLDFAKNIIRLCKKLPNNIVNMKLVDQLIRSAGSIGANYREANESLSKKDFFDEDEDFSERIERDYFLIRIDLRSKSRFEEGNRYSDCGVYRVEKDIVSGYCKM